MLLGILTERGRPLWLRV